MKHDYHGRDDGLLHCKVCNGAEGSLPSECPGRRMTDAEEEAVYAGTLDFKHGQWQTPAGVPEVAAPKRQRPNVIDPYEECAQCGKFHYTHADEKHAFIRKPADGVPVPDDKTKC